MRKRPIEEVLEAHAKELIALPGVVGAGMGSRDGQPCIAVLVSSTPAVPPRGLPTMLEGYPVVVSETGPIRAVDRKERRAR
jgi:hypothetical protein